MFSGSDMVVLGGFGLQTDLAKFSKVVGLPGFEPGSRDPQPRSIGQTNLQAPIGLDASEQSVKALTDLLLPVDAERGDLVDEVDVPHEHAPAAISLEAQVA